MNGIGNNPEADLTQGQRDAIQRVSDAFPTGYYMSLCNGRYPDGSPKLHVLISWSNTLFLCNEVSQML